VNAPPPPEAKPGLSRKAIIGWSVAMLAVLVLAWFVGAVVVPAWKTRRVVEASTILLSSVRPMKRSDALRELGGPEEAAKRLSFYLRLPNWIADQKPTAVLLLGCCGEAGIEPLIRVARSNDRRLRCSTIAVFRQLGPSAERAAPALIEMLGDNGLDPVTTQRLRPSVVDALIRVDPYGRYATAALIPYLRDEDWSLRYDLAIVLGSMGWNARETVPELERLLGDENQNVRRAAAEAIANIKRRQKKDAPK